MQTVNVELFKNAAAFTLTMRRFNNRRQGDMSQVQTDAEKGRLKLSKKLIESDEYDKVCAFQNELYTWCTKRCVPSFFKDGLYLVKVDQIEAFEAKLKDALAEQSILVNRLCEAYPAQVEAARRALNGQFNPRDYPSRANLPARFDISWNWIAFGVPENLPAELREKEAAKLEKQFQDASAEIIAALREGFGKVVQHVTERLTVAPGEKPKVFRDSLFDELTDFISTFNARNLMNDDGLEAVVNQAKSILGGVYGDTPEAKAQAARDYKDVRTKTAAAFAEVKQAVDKIIVDKPGRKFNLDDE